MPNPSSLAMEDEYADYPHPQMRFLYSCTLCSSDQWAMIGEPTACCGQPRVGVLNPITRMPVSAPADQRIQPAPNAHRIDSLETELSLLRQRLRDVEQERDEWKGRCAAMATQAIALRSEEHDTPCPD